MREPIRYRAVSVSDRAGWMKRLLDIEQSRSVTALAD